MLKIEDCKIGVRVECIDGSPHAGCCQHIVRGEIYTISGVAEILDGDEVENVLVTLEENRPCPVQHGLPPFWSRKRFKLPANLQEIFREALASRPAPVFKVKEKT
jgi:hypothetical protein